MEIARELAHVPGVVGVTLGGSRARGTALPGSDVDLGLYYRGGLDTGALRALAFELTGERVEVTEPGGWGPWVDGGAWLRVDGTPVDWIYRDLDRVSAVWDDCRAGRFTVGQQNGHPLGFYSHVYAGELALGQVLADPTGELGKLKAELSAYPEALRDALVADARARAPFGLAIAGKSVARRDLSYLAGCLFQVFGVLAQALHADAGRWLLNEKNAVAESAALPCAPARFGERVEQVFAGLGDPEAALGLARELVDEALTALPAG